MLVLQNCAMRLVVLSFGNIFHTFLNIWHSQTEVSYQGILQSDTIAFVEECS